MAGRAGAIRARLDLCRSTRRTGHLQPRRAVPTRPPGPPSCSCHLSCRRPMGVAGREVSRLVRGGGIARRAHRSQRSRLGAVFDARGGVMSELLLDAAGRRRSPATLPHFHAGREALRRGRLLAHALAARAEVRAGQLPGEPRRLMTSDQAISRAEPPHRVRHPDRRRTRRSPGRDRRQWPTRAGFAAARSAAGRRRRRTG
jgi:hypothetical protein